MLNFITKLLVLAALCSFLTGGAKAQAQDVGTGVLCDTQAQMEALVAAVNTTRDLATSLGEVNATAPGAANVCAVATVAYVVGDTVATVRTPDGLRDIVQITVVGVPVAQMGDTIIVQPLPPAVQYTLFKSKGEGV